MTRPPEDFVDDQPDWSPDGKLVAFERCQEGARAGDAAVKGFAPCTVWTVGSGGGEPRRVRVRCRLEGRCDASTPAWTPAAGGHAGKPLVDGEQWESAPDWGP